MVPQLWAVCVYQKRDANLASGARKSLETFSNKGERDRSREYIFLFLSFKLRLLYHTSFLVNVCNHRFWKMYFKTFNDLDPRLNLLEKYTRNVMQAGWDEEV